MSFVTLKLYAGDGTTFLGELPSFKNLKPMLSLNDVGAFSMDYPVNGVRASQLDQDADREIAVLIDGTERARYLLEDDGRSEIDVDLNKAVMTIAGREVSQLLDRGRVFPINGIGTTPASHPFTTASPGTILNTLLTRAQSRGALPGWTWDFTTTLDSSGAAWPSNITFEYKTNATVLDVLNHLSQTLGLIDWRVQGRVLHVYKANTTMRQDKTNAIFNRQTDFTKAERNRTRRDVANAMVVEGDDGVTVLRTDASSITLRGRREGYFSQSGVKDTGTLNVVGDLQLSITSAPKIAKPISVDFRTLTPQPFVDFNLGDYVYVGTEQNRVVRMSLDLVSSGILRGELDLNDKFDTRAVTAERKIKAIGGSVGAGAVVTPSNTNYTDTTIPAQVGTVGLSSVAYLSTKDIRAQVTATWPAVTQNTDGTAITDLQYYEPLWRYSTDSAVNGWKSVGVTTNTYANWSEVLPNRPIVVKVRAWDYSNHAGAFSTDATGTTASDATAPNAPSTPAIDVATMPMLARVTWDGLDNTATAMPLDFDHCEFHASTVNNFTPTAATLKGWIYAGAVFPIEWPADTTIYVKLIAVDRSNNKSTPSTQGTGLVRKAVDGEITSLTASKITAGIISSDITLSGRFATALTGARREMNSVGFQAWDASNNLIINLDGVNNLLTGQLQTARTGARTEIGTSGNTSYIKFFDNSGHNSYIGSITGDFLRLGTPIAGVWEGWNSIQILDSGTGTTNSAINGWTQRMSWGYGGGVAGAVQTFEIYYVSTRGTAGGGGGPITIRYRVDENNGHIFYTGSSARYWINDNGDHIWYNAAGQTVMQHDDSADSWYFYPSPPAASGGWIEIATKLSAGATSPRLKLFTEAGNGNLLCATLASGVMYTENISWDNTIYQSMRASAYVTVSDMNTKTDIQPFSDSALDKILAVAPKKYRRKGRIKTIDGELGPEPPEEIGLIAQEAPAQIVAGDPADKNLGIDLYQMCTLLWAGLTEAVTELRALKSQLPGKP